MNITVAGAGAIGGFLGGMLSRQGHNVSFIARGEHLIKMQENGLQLTSGLDGEIVKSHFTESFESVSEADLILFTVKSTETERMARNIAPYIKKDSFILTFQNGVNNEEILTEIFEEGQILSGAAHISAQVESPGVVRQDGNHIFYVGGLTTTNEESIKNIVKMFEEAGLHTKYSDRIIGRKWEKSLWNVTFNPLSAISGATVGEILDNPELLNTSKAILKEIVQIVKNLNINLRDKTIDRVFETAKLVRGHKTSMLQDKEKGRAMEVESLCGYFVKTAEELNLETPVLDTLYSLLIFIDQQRTSQ
ncbi:2-dehydropantoate 2-reductase [Salipaludibacillus keqinensis]|uniref:2-dehydropantoate 2-reductase n=1 Tax=Salipaludibacillus keqinensis TaxID=2045207 RepID=A0A323TD15_9BACI|nr:ketopantoate reductase family protein [Salipaludibacillus keqinensis]PYZ92991.1 2-dehydropantoate 2-reductase [Salipaludibacillus keqinensis]